MVLDGGALNVYSAASGKLKYQLEGFEDGRFVSAGHMSGSGKADLVISGGTTVLLVRIEDHGPSVVWTVIVDDSASSPIIGDIDIDGSSEIVIATLTGKLLAIDGD